MASGSRVKDADGRQRDVCCRCIPVRMGVFLNAMFTILGSFAMLLMKHEFEASTRLFTGGYSIISRTIIFFIEVTGCFWGFCGMIGAWQCRYDMVHLYNLYQWVRLATFLLMWWTDVPLLWQCEMWILDIDQAHKTLDFNPLVYGIALSGGCYAERWKFFAYSSVAFITLLYLALANYRFQLEISEDLPFLVDQPKDIPKGAFFSKSLAERAQLLADPRLQPVHV